MAMERQVSRGSTLLVVLAALFALVLAVTPALANKPDHAKGSKASAKSDHDGDADSDSGTTFTEDNDTNDGGTPNNVPDEGDNKHPSGKDRSVEHGKSGNQGNSESDPDDDGHGPDRSNGGPDKPNGSGGDDLADQDGNNGCGNDDDFEDDNEGWCGHKPKEDVGGGNEEKPPPCDEDETMPGNQPCGEEELPPGDVVVTPPPGGGTTTPPMVGGDVETVSPPGDEVLGEVLTRGSGPAVAGLGTSRPASQVAAAGALPFTGAGRIMVFFLIAVGLIGLGTLSMRAGRSRA
jgi:hypothetical protein